MELKHKAPVKHIARFRTIDRHSSETARIGGNGDRCPSLIQTGQRTFRIIFVSDSVQFSGERVQRPDIDDDRVIFTLDIDRLSDNGI